jgi:flagellar basal-body rod protein FlgB
MTKLIESIFGENLPGLNKMLDLTWRRNQAISSNVANAETPAYRAVDVNFAGELARAFGQESGAMLKTNGKHMDLESSGQSRLVADLSGATKPDGNNVDIDLQMGRLAYNSGKFSIASNLMRRQLQMLKRAITEGGR